ncbi:serine racemase [Exaiptasia diaphana]|uniref:L-serine ammonia-lyase n=1 Tax=Exaiptasia diaphana TaxID=2652724 RepID=A0A913XSZ2_EXADI|nr:serine racemase [Exaiptasia diaphana]
MSKIVTSGNEKKTVTLQDVQDASIRIGPFINHTPVMTCSTLDKMAGKSLFFKCENFQKTGAFKFRGAMNAVIRLTEGKSQDNLPEVVTYSSGNHGQGVALAAMIKGLKAHVVIPHYAPDIKKSAIRDYGARVIDTYGLSQEEHEEEARNVLEQTGPNSHLVSPCEDESIIAGQGTMALELLQQVPDIDAIIAPVGSGGMVSGISVAAKGIKPGIKIFVAEPLQANKCTKSFAAGERILLSG